ncbi:MAG: fibrobacter succinogenes major paralogous domain-containing protein [bacterium]|nr:fibrobacter succinogenes major paralogous domain-containing protein [bacterium]
MSVPKQDAEKIKQIEPLSHKATESKIEIKDKIPLGKKRLYITICILILIVLCGIVLHRYTYKTDDKEGNTYKTIKIGEQVWMAENLNVSHYRNGDTVPQVQAAKEWINLTTGAWCYYENNVENGKTYGKLYNWYAVNDPRGLAPEGWHIPTDDEWTILTNCLGGEDIAGGKLKENCTTLWWSPNTGATNKSGFSALPGGHRGDNNGAFGVIGNGGYWWSATEFNATYAWSRLMYYDYANVYRKGYNKKYGFSIRCVKN